MVDRTPDRAGASAARDNGGRCESGAAAERAAMQSSRRRRLVVPVVLAVTVAGAIVGLASSASGCGDDGPTVDASVGDAAPDTPIV